ncbi:MAG TPA: hypothetical protein VFQ51_10925, partial [Vicinamibacteria bacterium]|nr:hypothetical protein [Vicinamibacteria bacterium]
PLFRLDARLLGAPLAALDVALRLVGPLALRFLLSPRLIRLLPALRLVGLPCGALPIELLRALALPLRLGLALVLTGPLLLRLALLLLSRALIALPLALLLLLLRPLLLAGGALLAFSLALRLLLLALLFLLLLLLGLLLLAGPLLVLALGLFLGGEQRDARTGQRGRQPQSHRLASPDPHAHVSLRAARPRVAPVFSASAGPHTRERTRLDDDREEAMDQ